MATPGLLVIAVYAHAARCSTSLQPGFSPRSG